MNVGISSTDWIGVNDDIIDRGDYSGPGGARTVLRQTTIDAAILETARGGLLRRGLGVPRGLFHWADWIGGPAERSLLPQ